MTENGTTWTYTYNSDGLRTKRTNGSTTYEYVYNGSQLTQMTMNENGTLRTMYFIYDASGPVAINMTSGGTSTTYYYVKNIQGDIIAIVNKAGEAVVTYSYDAWGNILSIDGEFKNGLGVRSPLRYHGYVYDTESTLYYLQSRYYDPELGRFLNADALVSTGQGILGNNMFAYCMNSPSNGSDPCGTCFHHWKFWEDCEKCKANNSTEKFFENVADTAKSFVKNIEFSAGIGQGIYAEFEVLEIGMGIGMYGNYGTINYSQGEWYTGQELYSGVTATITPWLEFGAAEYFSRDNEGNEACVRWFGLNDTQETWTIFSAACYPIFAGASISVGFDIVTFLEEWDATWEE